MPGLGGKGYTIPNMQKAKSLWVAYILWLFGLHYLYFGKPLNLVFYWLTAWGLGIWALLDLFRMPRLVEELNPKSPESLGTPSPTIAATEAPRKLPLPPKNPRLTTTNGSVKAWRKLLGK